MLILLLVSYGLFGPRLGTVAITASCRASFVELGIPSMRRNPVVPFVAVELNSNSFVSKGLLLSTIPLVWMYVRYTVGGGGGGPPPPPPPPQSSRHCSRGGRSFGRLALYVIRSASSMVLVVPLDSLITSDPLSSPSSVS